MGDEEIVTIEGQFAEFAKMFDTDKTRDGTLMTLYRSDYWMRQAKLLDDRKVTMTDTGLIWFRWNKTELNYQEWWEFLQILCTEKALDPEMVEIVLTNCGLPGTITVVVPQYRDFFDTWKPKDALVE